MTDTYTCGECKKQKPLKEFPRKCTFWDGIKQRICKDCNNNCSYKLTKKQDTSKWKYKKVKK